MIKIKQKRSSVLFVVQGRLQTQVIFALSGNRLKAESSEEGTREPLHKFQRKDAP